MFYTNVMLWEHYGMWGIIVYLWPMIAGIMICNHHKIEK